MIKGILIYEENDSIKNKEYIKWLIDEGKVRDLDIELILTKDLSFSNLDCKFAINRSRNFNITEMLEEADVRVFNNFKFCLLGNDKKLAYDYVKSLGIDYPKIYEDISEFDKNKDIIEKPRNGHGGEGIRILDDLSKIDLSKNVYQEYIKDYIGDIRFYVINNKIEHAVIRLPKENSIISNFTKGGEVKIYNYSKYEEEIINKILSEINIDFGGIDFLLSKDKKILFNEFEDAVGSRMLSHLGINDTMDKFLDYISNEVKGME